MKWFKRKPHISDLEYGKLMTSFGRTVDRDPMIGGPAKALSERVQQEHAQLAAEIDGKLYKGATVYHLHLLAGSWLMAFEGEVPEATAEVFEEAVVWKFGPLAKGSAALPRRITELARGEAERDLSMDEGHDGHGEG